MQLIENTYDKYAIKALSAGIQAIDIADEHKAALAINQGHQTAQLLLADDRIVLPIAKQPRTSTIAGRPAMSAQAGILLVFWARCGACQAVGTTPNAATHDQCSEYQIPQLGIVVQLGTRLTATGLGLSLRNQSKITFGLAVVF